MTESSQNQHIASRDGDRMRFYTLSELRAKPKPKPVIPDLIRGNGITLLSGARRAGKTTAALAIAHAVATGGMVFGKQANQSGVVYVNGRGLDYHTKALETYTGRMIPDGAAFMIDGPTELAGDGDDLIDALRAVAEPYSLVIVDDVFNGDPTANRVIRACDRIREETGAAVMLVCAARDGSESAPIAFRSACDTHLHLSTTRTHGYLRCIKQRHAPAFEPIRLSRLTIPVGAPDWRYSGPMKTAATFEVEAS